MNEKPDFNNYFFEKLKYSKKQYKSMHAYEASKFANVAFTAGLNEYIQENKLQVKAVSLQPGMVRTDLFRDQPKWMQYLYKALYPLAWLLMKSEKEGAQTSLCLAMMPSDRLVSGGHYQDCALIQANPNAHDKEVVRQAWDATVSKLRELTDDPKIFGKFVPTQLP